MQWRATCGRSSGPRWRAARCARRRPQPNDLSRSCARPCRPPGACQGADWLADGPSGSPTSTTRILAARPARVRRGQVRRAARAEVSAAEALLGRQPGRTGSAASTSAGARRRAPVERAAPLAPTASATSSRNWRESATGAVDADDHLLWARAARLLDGDAAGEAVLRQAGRRAARQPARLLRTRHAADRR